MHQFWYIGGFKLQTYAVLMAIAALSGFAVALHEGSRRECARWTSLTPLSGPQSGDSRSAIGIRAGESGVFRRAAWRCAPNWQGGFAYHGGLLGGCAGADPVDSAETCAVLGSCGRSVAGILSERGHRRAACLFGGCVYGRMGFWPLYFTWYDIFGVTASRFAVQRGDRADSRFVWRIVSVSRPMPFPGATFVSFVLVSGLFHFGLSFGRGDETLVWMDCASSSGLHAVQVASAATIGWVRWLEAVRRPAVLIHAIRRAWERREPGFLAGNGPGFLLSSSVYDFGRFLGWHSSGANQGLLRWQTAGPIIISVGVVSGCGGSGCGSGGATVGMGIGSGVGSATAWTLTRAVR